METEITIGNNFDEAIGLLMTYRCNINCNYCYIHHKQNKDMSLEMAQSILEPFLSKSMGLLTIAFMGGETLLAFNTIKHLTEWIKAKKLKRKYRLFGSTNGTLLNEDMKQWLKSNADIITLGLSYDGIPSAQKYNRTELYVDLDFFINTWPKQPIQMTINTDSVEHMAEGIVYLLRKGAIVHPNIAFEEKEWPEAKIKSYASQLHKLIYFYNAYPEYPLIVQFIHDLNEYAECLTHHKPPKKVCGAGNSFRVYDVDGIDYPCHILSPLVLDKKQLKTISNNPIGEDTGSHDKNCDGCPFIKSCPTCIGCNFIYRGDYSTRDKTHCKLMKIEVMAFIKKEIIRLKEKKYLSPKDAAIIDSIERLVPYLKER